MMTLPAQKDWIPPTRIDQTFFVWPFKERRKKKEMCRGKKDSGMRRRFTKKGKLYPSRRTKTLSISADYMYN